MHSYNYETENKYYSIATAKNQPSSKGGITRSEFIAAIELHF